jgi:anti-sigma factor RsiW
MTRLTCREVVEFLMDYLDDALEPARRRTFENHLAECDECVAYLRHYEETVRLGKVAFADVDAAADEQLPRGLVDAILAARRRGD